MGDRRSADAYRNAPLMHSQMGYPYPPVAYQSDSEHVSPQALSQAPQSNFGILGDSIDPKNKRRRGNLPKPVTDILRAWFHEHLDHPYPSEEDKQMFMTRTGLTISQVSFSLTGGSRPPLLTIPRSAIGLSTQEDANSLLYGIKCEAEAKWTPNDNLL
jgi:hypothetical protein